METDDTLARLTFNAVATRAFFTDRTKGVRLRIESGVVAFRPVVARRGEDILALERRPRGVIAEVARDPLTRRLMRRLFKAGLSESQPYFKLEESTPRGWFSLNHHPADLPPQRQPLMVVSDFEPPLVTIDMGLWRRLQRAMASTQPVAMPLWQDFMEMFHSAVRMTERTTRGRKSSERIEAERLLAIIEQNVSEFHSLAAHQPEVADDVASLLFSVTGESVIDADDAVSGVGSSRDIQPKPEVSRQYVERVLTGKSTRRSRQKWPEASEEELREAAKLMEADEGAVAVESPPHTEPAPLAKVQSTKPKRRPRRKWPEATEEDLRAAAKLMESESDSNSEPEQNQEATDPVITGTDDTPDLAAVEQPEIKEWVTAETTPEIAADTNEAIIAEEEILAEERSPAIASPPRKMDIVEDEGDIEDDEGGAVEDEGDIEDDEGGAEQPVAAEPVVDPSDTPILDTPSTIEKPLAAEAFDPEPDPDPFFDEPVAVTETQPESSAIDVETHEGEAGFDLPRRPEPDRDEEELVDDHDDDEHDETKK